MGLCVITRHNRRPPCRKNKGAKRKTKQEEPTAAADPSRPVVFPGRVVVMARALALASTNPQDGLLGCRYCHGHSAVCAICPVRKAKFTEIEKFGRKKNGAQAGARHVSWESCQLSAHIRLGRSVDREDRAPQWGVVHEHTPVSIPVFMNTKIANSNFH